MARRRSPELLYVGIKHTVLALDRATGAEVWRTKLEKIRLRVNDFVGLSLDGDDLFATCGGELFCLDAKTGAVKWHNPLRKLGVGVVSVLPASSATPTPAISSPPPTVAQALLEAQQRRHAATGGA